MNLAKNVELTIKTTKRFLKNVKALPKFVLFRVKELLGLSKPAKSKLVLVISFPRSGTHALGSLVSQEDIGFRYHGEFFAFNHWSFMIDRLNRYYPFFSLRFFWSFKDQRQKWRTYRFESTSLKPIKTINALKKLYGIHVIKIFPTHLSDTALQAIIAQHKPHVIFLRRNHLDRFVSHKKANKTGKWHTISTEGVEIDINQDEFDKFISDYTSFYEHYFKVASDNGCEILDIEYEKLNDSITIDQIQRFAIWEEFTDFGRLKNAPTTVKQDSSRTIQDSYLKHEGRNLSDFSFTKIERLK